MALAKQPVIDAHGLLRSLAGKRPVFHSEAGLQFAFAWEAKERDPVLEVRLETHPEPAVRPGLQLIHADTWSPGTHGRVTNADAFRLCDGLVLSGVRSWGPSTGGTSRGCEHALQLTGTYPLAWGDYSSLDPGPAGAFRCLVNEVDGQAETLKDGNT